MIYLVTNSPALLPSPNYKLIGVEESLKILNNMHIIGLDTETSGLNPHLKDLLLVQMGNFDTQVVIDTRTVDILKYKELLEDEDKGFLLWNADFDLKFFYKYGIIVKNVYDGFLAERILYLGYPKGRHQYSLKAAADNYLGVELDKTVRGKIIWSKTLTDDIIVYGANDVKYLEAIMKKQADKLAKEGLMRAVEIECDYVKMNAYMEFCGVKLDEERWKKKMEIDKVEYDKCLNKLNEWVEEHCSDNEKFCHIELQGDLFEGFDDKPHCTINWNSSKQVIPFLESLGFNLLVKDKKTKLMHKSVEAEVIESQKEKSEISPVYLAYKEAQKVRSTYGQNFLDLINPVTHRIHTVFNSLGTDTARVSSGNKSEKDKETMPGKELSFVNLQNIPADEETRACFIAEKGNKWVSIDYHGQESFLMASIANDKAMLDELINGSGDMHSLTAKMAYPDIIGDCPVKDIKAKFKHYRQEAKNVEFAINYGGNADTLHRNKGIPQDQADQIYKNYMRGFSGLCAYQNFRRKDVMEKGYILMSPISCYRAHIYDFDKLKDLQNCFTRQFWDDYKLIPRDANGRKKPRNEDEEDMCQKVSTYFKRKSDSERQSINYPIQHAGAMCYKIAAIDLFNWIVENKLFNVVKVVIGCHDEIDFECPEDIVDIVTEKTVEFMEHSGAIFCTRAPLTADVEIGDHWIH